MSSWDRKCIHWINMEFAETRAPLAWIQEEPHSCIHSQTQEFYMVQDIGRKGNTKPSEVCSTKMLSSSLQPFLFSTKKFVFWLILPSPLPPV